MKTSIKWGIIGTGRIADKFATGLKFLSDAELVAVGSRSQESAQRFASRFDIPRVHASYEALVEDSEVEVVYIATPHSLHKDNSLLCLQAGKAVLCEKPFTINAREAEVVVNVAKDKGLFLMEAMWSRFLPALVKLRELLAEGIIGKPRLLQADFGYRADLNPEGRLFNPVLGGGALLDVGVYPISLASMIFGTPTRITGQAHLGETMIDEQSAVILSHSGGEIAVLSSAVRTSTPQEATLMGTEGWIRIEPPWWRGSRLRLALAGKEPDVIEVPFEGNGYNYEAAHVMDCLRTGRPESDVMSLAETLSIMRTMDEVRSQWGLIYPMEG